MEKSIKLTTVTAAPHWGQSRWNEEFFMLNVLRKLRLSFELVLTILGVLLLPATAESALGSGAQIYSLDASFQIERKSISGEGTPQYIAYIEGETSAMAYHPAWKYKLFFAPFNGGLSSVDLQNGNSVAVVNSEIGTPFHQIALAPELNKIVLASNGNSALLVETGTLPGTLPFAELDTLGSFANAALGPMVYRSQDTSLYYWLVEGTASSLHRQRLTTRVDTVLLTTPYNVQAGLDLSQNGDTLVWISHDTLLGVQVQRLPLSSLIPAIPQLWTGVGPTKMRYVEGYFYYTVAYDLYRKNASDLSQDAEMVWSGVGSAFAMDLTNRFPTLGSSVPTTARLNGKTLLKFPVSDPDADPVTCDIAMQPTSGYFNKLEGCAFSFESTASVPSVDTLKLLIGDIRGRKEDTLRMPLALVANTPPTPTQPIGNQVIAAGQSWEYITDIPVDSWDAFKAKWARIYWDQSNSAGADTVCHESVYEVEQTFRAGKSGVLGGLRLHIRPRYNDVFVNIEIRATDRDGPLLYKTVDILPYTGDTLYHQRLFAFPQGPALDSGTTYSFRVSGAFEDYMDYCATGTDSYAEGQSGQGPDTDVLFETMLEFPLPLGLGVDSLAPGKFRLGGTPQAEGVGTWLTAFFVTDGLDVYSDHFQLEVFPINTAPSFIPGTSPTFEIQYEAGTNSYPGWFTSISRGQYVYEESQELIFQIEPMTASDSQLFEILPWVQTSGTNPGTADLYFGLKSYMSGTANMRVRLVDDGGTEHGGVDSSAWFPFQIRVNAEPTLSISWPNTLQVGTSLDLPINAADFDRDPLTYRLEYLDSAINTAAGAADTVRDSAFYQTFTAPRGGDLGLIEFWVKSAAGRIQVDLRKDGIVRASSELNLAMATEQVQQVVFPPGTIVDSAGIYELHFFQRSRAFFTLAEHRGNPHPPGSLRLASSGERAGSDLALKLSYVLPPPAFLQLVNGTVAGSKILVANPLAVNGGVHNILLAVSDALTTTHRVHQFEVALLASSLTLREWPPLITAIAGDALPELDLSLWVADSLHPFSQLTFEYSAGIVNVPAISDPQRLVVNYPATFKGVDTLRVLVRNPLNQILVVPIPIRIEPNAPPSIQALPWQEAAYGDTVFPLIFLDTIVQEDHTGLAQISWGIYPNGKFSAIIDSARNLRVGIPLGYQGQDSLTLRAVDAQGLEGNTILRYRVPPPSSSSSSTIVSSSSVGTSAWTLTLMSAEPRVLNVGVSTTVHLQLSSVANTVFQLDTTQLPPWVRFQSLQFLATGWELQLRVLPTYSMITEGQADNSGSLALNFKESHGALAQLRWEYILRALVLQPSVTVIGQAVRLQAVPTVANIPDQLELRVHVYSGNGVDTTLVLGDPTVDMYPLPVGNYEAVFKVVGADGSYLKTWTRSFEVESPQIVLGGEQWQMLGFGGQRIPWAAFQPGTLLFHWNDEAAQDPLYGRYIAGNRFEVTEPGSAYWIWNDRPETLSVALPTEGGIIAVSALRGATGWNMIANPYSWPVEARLFLDGREIPNAVFHQWMPEQGDYRPVSVLLPHKGYWVQVPASGLVRIIDTPAWQGQVASKVIAGLRTRGEWDLQIILRAGPRADRYNYVGISAETDRDGASLAWAKPPAGMGDQVTLVIIDPKVGALSRSVRSSQEVANWTWNIEISATSPRDGELEIPGLPDLLREGYRLFWTYQGKTQSLTRGSIQVALNKEATAGVLQVFPPDAEYAQPASSFELGLVRDGKTWKVEYTLPPALWGSPVTLEVCDIRGTILWSRNLPSHGEGSQVYGLDGLEMRSGLYFVRARIGSYSSVRAFFTGLSE